MPSAAQITITLSLEAIERVRSKLERGGFADESEVIENAILDSILPPQEEARNEQWIRTEGVRRYDAMRTEPSRGLTADQAFAFLDVEE